MILTRAIRKVLIDPFRYGFRDYDAERYWRDRYGKHRLALSGSGNEALTESENLTQYEEDKARIRALLLSAGVRLSPATRVLDVGCGNGQYTEMCRQAGVRSYEGVDITDSLFDSLGRQYPGYAFRKGDCTGPRLGHGFDCVLMIDVIEHIVNREKLLAAMANARAALTPGGVFVVGPALRDSRKRMFYLHEWTETDIAAGFDVVARCPFKAGEMLALRTAVL